MNKVSVKKLECAMRQSEQVVGCIPWSMPHNLSSKMCDPWMEKEFFIKFANFDEKKCPDCLPDCEGQKITMVSTSAKFRLKNCSFLKFYFISILH